MTRYTVVFIVPYNWIATSPAMLNSANLLAEAGFDVDFFLLSPASLRAQFSSYRFASLHIRTHYFNIPDSRAIFRLNQFWRFGRWIGRCLSGRKIGMLFGVDQVGLIIAAFMGRYLRVPFAYFSLEIALSGETSRFATLLKPFERWAHSKASFTVIQDKDRGDLLARDNQVSQQRFFYLPNAPIGPGTLTKEIWLHERLNIPLGFPIILYSGGIAKWAQSLELAENISDWPENTILVFHERAHISESDPYLQRVRRVSNSRRVRFLLEVLDPDELGKLYGSATIGIALYKNVDSNHTVIAYASGKIAQYLKHGVPIITNDYPNLRKLINDYGCGVCVTSMMDIGGAIKKILGGYAEYRNCALRCFTEAFEFKSHFKTISEEIVAVSQRQWKR
jgi:glycosyltransferase involved in cell wall biosynthesis